MDAILAEARAERLFPGDGELDLVGLLRAMPRDIALSVEVPTHTLAKTIGATERARRALAATKHVLAQLGAAADLATAPATAHQ
jgi:sugar phosphate isomerase/epimerase